MGKEFELKYAAGDPAVLDEILAYVGRPAEEISMASTYFDTPKGDLSARKWTLRLRQENDDFVVTFKTAGDGSTRGEWEYNADSVEFAATTLVDLGAPWELEELLSDGALPVCGAAFLRRAVMLELDGTTAELALDCGRLFRGQKELPLCEMEVELKEGSEAAVRRFAEDLAKQFGLKEEPKSKFVRAVTL